MPRTDKWDWYKRYPQKFIRGVRGLGPELIGAYAVILDLIYEDEDSCPNDPHWLGGILGCSSRKAAALIQQLVLTGKLQVNQSGRLVNEKANSEIENRANSQRRSVETGASGGRKSAALRAQAIEINKLAEQPLDQERTDKSRKEQKRKKEVSAAVGSAIASPSGAPASLPVAAVVETELHQAVKIYNDGVALCPDRPNGFGNAGWAKAVSITANREKALRARLKEVGLDGWRAAVTRAARSDFLSGRAKRQPGRESWGVDLGWLAKAENFAKLTEGKYDNDRGHVVPRGQDSARAGLMDFLREGPTDEVVS